MIKLWKSWSISFLNHFSLKKCLEYLMYWNNFIKWSNWFYLANKKVRVCRNSDKNSADVKSKAPLKIFEPSNWEQEIDPLEIDQIRCEFSDKNSFKSFKTTPSLATARHATTTFLAWNLFHCFASRLFRCSVCGLPKREFGMHFLIRRNTFCYFSNVQ